MTRSKPAHEGHGPRLEVAGSGRERLQRRHRRDRSAVDADEPRLEGLGVDGDLVLRGPPVKVDAEADPVDAMPSDGLGCPQ
jgi:hypothetical protein